MRMPVAVAVGICVALCGCEASMTEGPATGTAPAASTGGSGAQLSSVREAMQICLRNYDEPAAILSGFRAASYSYEPEDFGGGEVLHWFTSPDGVATVMLVPAEGDSACAVSTKAMGVGEALPFARAVMEETLNAEVDAGSPEGENIVPGHARAGSASCSGYSVLVPRRLIWVQVGMAGQDPVCVENGTSQIIMRM